MDEKSTPISRVTIMRLSIFIGTFAAYIVFYVIFNIVTIFGLVILATIYLWLQIAVTGLILSWPAYDNIKDRIIYNLAWPLSWGYRIFKGTMYNENFKNEK